MWTGLPDLSFVSASNLMVQVDTSTPTFARLIASGPGLIVPETLSPSQANTNVRCVLCVAFGPQSPIHVPVSGWPCWASNVTAEMKRLRPTTQKLCRIVAGEYSATRNYSQF